MSPMLDGFSFSMYRCIPALSSWNTSVVLPEDSSSKVAASSRGSVCRSISTPRLSRTSFTALVQDGEAGQAEEVHLQQAQVGHRVPC